MANAREPSRSVLVVDVDHSLARVDLLWEQLAWLLLRRPHLLFGLALLLLRGRGKAAFKDRLARLAHCNVETLPLHPGVLALMEQARRDGRRVVLASATNERFIEPLAARVGADGWLASTPTLNLKGAAKREAIEQLLGDKPFEYVGDSTSDLAIWRDASHAFVVEPTRGLWARVQALSVPATAIRDEARVGLAAGLLSLVRPHQWAKNALVAAAPLAAHQFGPALASGMLPLAFVVACAMSSAGYIVNDLIDTAGDRQHPSKRHRPLASGAVPIWMALVTLFILLATLVVGSAFLPPGAREYVAVYAGLFVAYNILKSRPILDVVLLSCFYTVRILLGAEATALPVSEWMLAFSVVLFFGLAMAKRYGELLRLDGGLRGVGRGYVAGDQVTLLVLGVGSSLLSVLVAMLYFASPNVRVLYSAPQHLWLLPPVHLYWISRLWLITARGDLHDDPVVFALKDAASWIVLGAALLILWAST